MPRPPTSPLLAALVLLALGASCGDGRAELYVHGAAIVVRTSAPFARSADLPVRLEATLAAALAYWGGGWAHLAGRRITILEGPYVPCAGALAAVGCFDGDLSVSASDPGAGTFRCVEQTVLVHEVGHAVIGDGGHGDPRWMDFEPLRAALSGRVGWTPDGAEVSCDVALGVWRHPPDRG